MIVFVPTYNRTKVLPFVVQSILNSDISGIDDRLVVLIHNNYPPAKKEIDELIDHVSKETRFEFKVIHREKVIIPLDAWFQAIFSVANEDETVIILGDDDLVTPWGIKNRFIEINRLNGDFLLSNFIQRIYFFDGGMSCWPNFGEIDIPKGITEARKWTYSAEGHTNTTFISNHCFRNTKVFRDGLNEAFSWCNQQQWAPRIYTTGLIPSYLTYAIQASGGNVLSFDEKSVIRGSIFEEAVKGDYSDGGSTSFYCLLTLNIFSNKKIHKDIEQYESLRDLYLKALRSNFFEILGNKNISFSMIHLGLKNTGLKWSNLLGIELFNYRSFLSLFPFIRGRELKREFRKQSNLKPTHLFLDELKQRYKNEKHYDQ